MMDGEIPQNKNLFNKMQRTHGELLNKNKNLKQWRKRNNLRVIQNSKDGDHFSIYNLFEHFEYIIFLFISFIFFKIYLWLLVI